MKNLLFICILSLSVFSNAETDFEHMNAFIFEALETPDEFYANQLGNHACRIEFNHNNEELIAQGDTHGEAMLNVIRRCLIKVCQHNKCEEAEARFLKYEFCTKKHEIQCIKF